MYECLYTVCMIFSGAVGRGLAISLVAYGNCPISFWALRWCIVLLCCMLFFFLFGKPAAHASLNDIRLFAARRGKWAVSVWMGLRLFFLEFLKFWSLDLL